MCPIFGDKNSEKNGNGEIAAAGRAEFMIQNEPWSFRAFGAQPEKGPCEWTFGMRIASLRRAEAAACTAFTGPKFKIQYSKLKEASGHAWAYIPVRDAACGGHARCGPAGRELRASAAGGCGPPIPLGSILLVTSPPPGGCCARQGANSKFRISFRATACGLPRRASGLLCPRTANFGTQPAEGTLATLRSSGSPPPPGCGPLGPDGPILNLRPARPPGGGLHLRVLQVCSYSPSAWLRAFAVVQSCVIGGAFRKLRPDDYKPVKIKEPSLWTALFRQYLNCFS